MASYSFTGLRLCVVHMSHCLNVKVESKPAVTMLTGDRFPVPDCWFHCRLIAPVAGGLPHRYRGDQSPVDAPQGVSASYLCVASSYRAASQR